MTNHKPTAVDYIPAAYELGKMFYRAGREYNPYSPDTENFTEFNRGRLDAEEEYKEALDEAFDIPVGFTPHCSSDKLKQDAELARKQYHMPH